MKAISIQVQPDRSYGLDTEKLKEAFAQLAVHKDLVLEKAFESNFDEEPYLNFTFETTNTAALWDVIWRKLYLSPEFGVHMAYASMAVSANVDDWSDYTQLYHFENLPRASELMH